MPFHLFTIHVIHTQLAAIDDVAALARRLTRNSKVVQLWIVDKTQAIIADFAHGNVLVSCKSSLGVVTIPTQFIC